MTTRRLFPATNGPSAASAYSGPYQAGVIFEVTAGNQWLDGYWWWVCSAGQQTTPVTAALWQSAGGPVYTLVPASSVTSGTLSATPVGGEVGGHWNYIPLAAPIALSQGVAYTAVIGFQCTAGFPFVASQFGSGQPYSSGITQGPLFAYSDASGSAPPPASQTQGLFGVGAASSANANANYPTSGSSGSANFFVDVQIDSVAPLGASYSIWPSQPYPINWVIDDTTPLGQVVTVGTEFTLAQPCTLNAIRFYSPPTATSLPTKCAIYSVPGQTIVSGTLNSSPSWSGAAASGWISVPYSGVTLPAGEYKVAVSAPAGKFNATTGPNYWQSPGPGANGIVNGPITAPNNASATSPGQSSYQVAPDIAFPATNTGPYTYWVDIQVTPIPVSGSAALSAAASLTATARDVISGAAHLAAGTALSASGITSSAAHLKAAATLTCSALSVRINITPGTVFTGSQAYGPLEADSYVVVPAIIDGVYDT